MLLYANQENRGKRGRGRIRRPYDMQKAYHCDKGGDMNTLKRLGSYKTQYKLVSGFLSGHTYTALTANQLLETTRPSQTMLFNVRGMD